MTKEEWVRDTVKAVEDAGFEVTFPQKLGGIPMVTTPEGLLRKRDFFKLRLPHGGQKKIYAEGILLLPMGM